MNDNKTERKKSSKYYQKNEIFLPYKPSKKKLYLNSIYNNIGLEISTQYANYKKNHKNIMNNYSINYKNINSFNISNTNKSILNQNQNNLTALNEYKKEDFSKNTFGKSFKNFKKAKQFFNNTTEKNETSININININNNNTNTNNTHNNIHNLKTSNLYKNKYCLQSYKNLYHKYNLPTFVNSRIKINSKEKNIKFTSVSRRPKNKNYSSKTYFTSGKPIKDQIPLKLNIINRGIKDTINNVNINNNILFSHFHSCVLLKQKNFNKNGNLSQRNKTHFKKCSNRTKHDRKKNKKTNLVRNLILNKNNIFYNNNCWISSRNININNNVSKKKKKNNLQCLNLKDRYSEEKNKLFNLIMCALNKKKSKSTKKESQHQKEENKDKMEKKEKKEKEKKKNEKIMEKNEEDSKKTVILNESKNDENNDEEQCICGNLLNNSFRLKKNSKSDLAQNSFLLLYSNLCCDENENYDESNLKYLYALVQNQDGEKNLEETETPLKTNHFGSEKEEENSGVLTYNEVKDIIIYYNLTEIGKENNYLFKKDDRNKFDKNFKKKYANKFLNA